MIIIRNILFILIFLPLIALAEATGEKCIQRADHKATSILLVDLSDKITDLDNFKKSISVLSEMIHPGERLIIGISTDKVGDVKLLMDFVNPEDSLWVSKLKIRALQKTFKDCLAEGITKIAAFDQKFDKSAILETINFAAKIFSADASSEKRLFIYSDMMQNSPSLSFYNQKSFEVKSLIEATKKEELIPKLEKIAVYIAGVGAHESDKKVRELEKYWQTLFTEAGAILKYFGPVLIGSL
jgi:hypothetical protein